MPFGAFKKQKFKQIDDRQHKQMGAGWRVGGYEVETNRLTK